MTEEEYLVCLTSFVVFGPIREKLLLDYFGSAKMYGRLQGLIFLKLV